MTRSSWARRAAVFLIIIAGLAGPARAQEALRALCGDVSLDARIDVADTRLIRQHLADPSGTGLTFDALERCNTTGQPRPCDLADLVVLARSQVGLAPGIQPACPAVTEPDPSTVSPGQLSALGGQPTGAAGVVGAVDASFDVNSYGAAVYTIPIKVPPGTQGMEPRIALAYNSQGGHGLAGVGFEISGLSSIERCPATVAQDGYAGAVGYNENDRFCLDGLRLVKVDGPGSGYANPGSVYFTEGQTWTRIEAGPRCDGAVRLADGSQALAGGPCGFTATLKNGTIVEYGEQEQAPCSMLPGGPARSTWPMTRVTDPRGNSMTVHYSGGGLNQCVPERIEYTGNERLGAPPLREVRFLYDTRISQVTHFTAGVARRLGVTLDRIQTWIRGPAAAGGEEMVREYVLSYQVGSDTLRERLEQIEECDGAGICLPPTEFQWQDGNWLGHVDFYNPPPASLVTPDVDRAAAIGDLDGDAKPDFIQVEDPDVSQQGDEHWRLYLTKGAGIQWYIEDWIDHIEDPDDIYINQSMRSVNIAGGPTNQILETRVAEGSAMQWKLYSWSENSGMAVGPFAAGFFPNAAPYARTVTGDFTGDGRTDVLVGNELYAWTFNPQIASFVSQGIAIDVSGAGKVLPADFNGDGRVDLLVMREFATDPNAGPQRIMTTWELHVSLGTTFMLQDSGIWPLHLPTILTGDFNGDGLSDVIVKRTENIFPEIDGYVMLHSTGTTLLPRLTTVIQETIALPNQPAYQIDWGYTAQQPDSDDQITTADWNADGMTDVLLWNPGDPDVEEIQVWRSLGDQILAAPNGTIPMTGSTGFLAGDLFGVGRTAVLMRSTDIYFNGPIFYHSTAQEHPDLLTGVTNGEQLGIDVDYYPMSSDFLYTPGSGSLYPDRNWIDTRYLVWRTDHDDGTGKGYEAWYGYQNAMTNLEGLGFLGFEQVEVQTQGKTLKTHYFQLPPFSGAIDWQQEWYALAYGPHLASWIDYSYEDISTTPGVYEVVPRFERTRTGFSIGGPYSWLDAPYEAQREWIYGAYGTVLQVIDEAEVGDPGHTLVSATQYLNDPVAWRLGYPALVETFDASMALLSRKQILYDASMNPRFQGDWDATHGVYLGSTLVHDAWGNPEQSLDPLNEKTDLQYDAYGFLTWVRNPLGHELMRVVDPRFGTEIARVDVNGNDTEIKVDGFGRTTAIHGREPGGTMTALRLFSLTSTGYGHVAQTWTRRDWGASEWDWKEEFHDALGRVYRTRKRGEGNDAIVTDLEYEYSRDRLERESKPYFESDTPIWTEYKYDFRGRVREVALPGGQLISIDVDESTRTVTRTEPDSAQTIVELDPRGKLLSRTDPENAINYFSHDPLGRLWRVADADGVITETVYDTLGRRTSVTDRDTGTTTFEHDASGHVVAEVDARGQRIERDYDPLDRTTEKRFYPAASPFPARRVVFEYDDTTLTHSLGQLSHVDTWVGPGAGVLESSYDFAYDRYGRQRAAALGIDGKSFVWTKSYDAAGQAREVSYPDGSILRTTYTAAGSLSRLQLNEPLDPPGAFTTYARYTQYDAQGRPGLLLQGNDTATCWIYDEQRGTLLETATSHFAGGGFADSCRRGETMPGETRLLAYEYLYDDVNRVDAIDDRLDPTRSQSFGYSARGELTYAQGLYGTHTYGYDDSGNMTWRDGETLIHQGSRLVQGDFLFLTYDDNGNLESKAGQGSIWSYTWDVEDRLSQVTRDGQTTRYTYDFDGKRIRKRDADGRTTWYASALYEVTLGPDGAELHTKYVPGPAGPLAQISRTGVQLVSMPAAQHLHRSRMYDRTHPVGWLHAQRHLLLSATSSPEFHRGLVMGTWISGCAVLLLLLAAGIHRGLRSGARLLPVPASGIVALGMAFAFFTTFGLGPGAAHAALIPGSNGPGVPVSGTYYFHPDHLGSTTVVTDALGAEVSRLAYDPWGNVHQPGSSGADIYRAKFTGKEYDSGPGLHFLESRYYDSTLQRFISADASLGVDPLRGASMHRYAYAANNPVTYVDPGGQSIFAAFLLIGSLMVGGALIAGTEGKILSDPAHAFDNWSWTRALFGAWVGLVVGVATFGLSLAFSGVTIAGIEVGQVVSQAFVHGVIDATFAYASGEADAGKLFAYFGIGMVAGFLSGAAPAVGAALGEVGGKLATETAGTLLTSSLKRAVDGKHAFSVRVWAFSLQFRKDGSVEFGADYMYLASQAISTVANQDTLQRGDGSPDDPWSWDRLAPQAAHPEDGAVSWIASQVRVEDFGTQAASNLYGVLETVGRGVAVYAVREVVSATGAGQHVMDAANFAVDQGFGDAFQNVVEPEGFADLAKGKLD